jgi:hypothetical protein
MSARFGWDQQQPGRPARDDPRGPSGAPAPARPPGQGGPAGAVPAAGDAGRPAPARPAVPPAQPATAPLPPAAQEEAAAAGPEPLYRVLGGLAMRDLTLVESLLQEVERLERREEDPQQLELLFRIDHLATRMRRNSENLLVLAGESGAGPEFEPVPLLDVTRAAISEITDYRRAQVTPMPDVHVIGLAADDLSHILAELLDNATSKSPESAPVIVRAERTGDGTLVVSVEDSGIGIPPDRLADINTRLSRPPVLDMAATRHMGVYVVSRLAHRHGIRVQLRERQYGGIVASVILPADLLVSSPSAPSAAPASSPRRESVARPPAPGAAPPGASGDAPAAPHVPRFEPADPTDLPRRTPRSLSATNGMPMSGMPTSRPAAGPPPAPSPPRLDQPPPDPASETGPLPAVGEPGELRAGRIRDELAGFQLGQRAARAGAAAPVPEPEWPVSTGSDDHAEETGGAREETERE